MFKAFFDKKSSGEKSVKSIKPLKVENKIESSIISLNPRVDRRKTFNANGNQACFEGRVLLKDDSFDFEDFKNDLSNIWFISLVEKASEDGVRVFDAGTLVVTYNFVNEQVPNREAEFAAAKNYMWSESLNQTREHKAYIEITVKGRGTPTEKGLAFTKIMDICCEQECVLGVFTNGTVYNPETYKDYASVMDVDDNGPLPILNLVWMGFSKSENGFNMYTRGLKAFDKDEMEIIASTLTPNALLNAMLDIVSYILENNVTLHDGEAIILAEHKKWRFKRSKAVAYDGMSLKIEWKK